MFNYIKLMRPKHYLKNIIIFFPLVFSGQITDTKKLLISFLGFLSFCILSSAVYCFNDINDLENDKTNPRKKNRPLASGKISKKSASIFMFFLLLIAFGISIATTVIYNLNPLFIVFEFTYFIINLGYSYGLKDIPILDVAILVLGYLIRLSIGGVITDIEISTWLYLTVMSGSFFMGFGKRRNELIQRGYKDRFVLKKYNKEFLDRFMYVFVILSVVFYSLWCIDSSTIARVGNNYLIWTIPYLLVILMKYTLDIEMDSHGDPVDLIFEDKFLLTLIIGFIILMSVILYVL